MNSFSRGIALLALGMVQASVLACDYCLISQGVSPLDTVRGHGLRVSQRYTLQDSVYDGGDEISNPGAKEEYYTTDIAGFYSPREWLTTILNVPMRVTHVDGHLEHGGHHHDDEHADEDHGGEDEAATAPAVDPQQGGDGGLGDVSLLMRARVMQRHTLASSTVVALLAGVKLPTGDTDGRADGGEYLDAHAQLGTGSTDGLFGFSMSHARGRWSLAANLLGALKNEGEAGTDDYEYGNSLNYDLTGRYRISPAVIGGARQQTFLSLGLAGEAQGHEQDDGIRVEGSGGHVLFVQPGAQLSVDGRWTFEISAQVPVVRDLSGIQLSDDFKVLGSVTFLL